MSVSWYKQKIYCLTENTWVYDIVESETLITVCPNNSTHSCLPGSASIVNHLSNNVVKIQEETPNSKTGGYYRCEGRAFNVPANTTVYDAFLPLIDTSILCGHLRSTAAMEGDTVNAYVIPQTSILVGYATNTINVGDTVINVSFSVLMMVEVHKLSMVYFQESTGRKTVKYAVTSVDYGSGTITLKNDINMDDGNPLDYTIGVYIYLDSNIIGAIAAPVTTTSTWITVATPAYKELIRGRFIVLFQHNQNYTEERMIVDTDAGTQRVCISEPFDKQMIPSLEAPVYLQLLIKTVNNIELDSVMDVTCGGKTVGGTYIDVSQVLCLVYTRNKETSVRVRYWYEIFY